MAYLGKEYVFEKDDNFDLVLDALTAAGLPAEAVGKYKDYKPTIKLEKNGDTYTNTTVTPRKTNPVTFKSGEGFVEQIREGFSIYNEYVVDGDTVTQTLKFKKEDSNFITLKREYSGDKLKISITGNFFDGAGYRYYSVA